MSREHAGGAPRIAVEWRHDPRGRDHAEPIPIAQFDFDALDSFEDQCREALESGTLAEFLETHRRRQEREALGRFFVTLCSVLLHAPNKERAAMEMIFASGLHLMEGISGARIARDMGIRKQAFYQGVERMAGTLSGIKLVIVRLNQRSPMARDTMRRSNYRSAPKA